MSMEKTLQELADFLHGTLENEDPALRITGVNGLVEAGPTEISFAVPPYVEFCHKSRAGAMILAPEQQSQAGFCRTAGTVPPPGRGCP